MSEAANRLWSWVLTGPIGRIAAFCGDLAAAWLGWAARKLGLRNP